MRTKSVPRYQNKSVIWDSVAVKPATNNIPAIPAAAMAKAMGTPITIKNNINKMIKIPITLVSMLTPSFKLDDPTYSQPVRASTLGLLILPVGTS